MKVKFNVPTHRFQSKFSFDNNTSFGIGNVQPLFCKYVVPKSKLNIDFGQLTRLSPLVVPTFARLRQLNKFVYVNINKIFPAFDAFLSQTQIIGTWKVYIPKSVPCTTNHDLFCYLVSKFAWVNGQKEGSLQYDPFFRYKLSNGNNVINVRTNSKIIDNLENLRKVSLDFNIDFTDVSQRPNVNYSLYIKLNQDGRYWYSLLRGLGYSVDYYDHSPVSILPLWAFYKAYYDVFYPKRFNAWHFSNAYRNINRFYNGDFDQYDYHDVSVDFIKYNPLDSLFGQDIYSFTFYGVLDNDIFSACLPKPLNNNINPDNSIDTSSDHTLVNSSTGLPYVNSQKNEFAADDISVVHKLWSYVTKSSVVGQSVKDWFKVHFGVSPSEDMFDSSVLIADKDNFININQVVSNASTDSAQLGDLAGQAYSQASDKVSFDVPQFGYVMCLSCIIPYSRISGGTQPESYNVTLFQQPFPDFDGLGYEVINNSSLYDHNLRGYYLNGDNKYDKGFGFVPRYSSFKVYNNIRSGGFSLPSIKDTYLSYCEDTIVTADELSPQIPTSSGMETFWPWRYSGIFESYNRIFYNQHNPDSVIGVDYVDDNFLCQTAFDVSYSSYLKPLSDSYSIESLGKDLLSVKRQ